MKENKRSKKELTDPVRYIRILLTGEMHILIKIEESSSKKLSLKCLEKKKKSRAYRPWISYKIFGAKSRNPVKVDKTRKVWYPIYVFCDSIAKVLLMSPLKFEIFLILFDFLRF